MIKIFTITVLSALNGKKLKCAVKKYWINKPNLKTSTATQCCDFIYTDRSRIRKSPMHCMFNKGFEMVDLVSTREDQQLAQHRRCMLKGGDERQ
jgi:hypothetical protein